MQALEKICLYNYQKRLNCSSKNNETEGQGVFPLGEQR